MESNINFRIRFFSSYFSLPHYHKLATFRLWMFFFRKFHCLFMKWKTSRFIWYGGSLYCHIKLYFSCISNTGCNVIIIWTFYNRTILYFGRTILFHAYFLTNTLMVLVISSSLWSLTLAFLQPLQRLCKIVSYRIWLQISVFQPHDIMTESLNCIQMDVMEAKNDCIATAPTEAICIVMEHLMNSFCFVSVIALSTLFLC